MEMNCNMSMMNCSMNMGMGPMEMQMHFHFGSKNVTVLFEGWNINSIGAMIGSFIAIFAMAILYEGLKVLREVIQQKKGNICSCTKKIRNSVRYEKLSSSIEQLASLNYGTIERKQPQLASMGLHIIQTLLHMLQVTISYFLMLIVMTYNMWLFIAVVLGAGTGYFLFARFRGPAKMHLQDENEHCH